MALVESFSELILSSKLPKYEESLSCYISACQEDPVLKSFDSSLQQRTIKLIGSLAGRGGKTGNLTLDSLIEVSGFLVDLSQDVAKIIIDNDYDLSKNKELKSLVDLYFESTTKTLNLFNTVKKCVGKAKMSQLIIRVAIKQFETESDFGGNKKKDKYAETLKELNKVKAMGDPFGVEFTKQYESVYKEQVMLLGKFRELQEVQLVLEKKHRKLTKWRRLGNIVFATVLLSVFATALLASPVVAAVAMAMIPCISTAGTCVIMMLKDYGKALKTQIDLFQSMENSTKVNIGAVETVKSLVDALITSISLILETVEVAVEKREEEAVKLVMQEISKNVEEFTEKIEQVGAHVAECSNSVVSGRVLVLKHMTNSASLK